MKRALMFILSLVIITGLIAGCEVATKDLENLQEELASESSTLTADKEEPEVTASTSSKPTYKEILEENLIVSFSYKENLSKEEILIEKQNIENYALTIYNIIFNQIEEEDRNAAIFLIKGEARRLREIYKKYEEDYDKIVLQEEEQKKWENRMDEYPTATRVWKHLTELMGCNEYVAAGIIGNMMAECGGQTLSLDWQAMNPTQHYGLCQWSTGYTAVRGADLQGQLDFMTVSIPDEISRYGSICYKSGFDYEDFMAMTDAEEAAYAFCVIYERPGSGPHNQRRANALVALEYFTN